MSTRRAKAYYQNLSEQERFGLALARSEAVEYAVLTDYQMTLYANALQYGVVYEESNLGLILMTIAQYSGRPGGEENWYAFDWNTTGTGLTTRWLGGEYVREDNLSPHLFAQPGGTEFNWLNVVVAQTSIWGIATEISVTGPKPTYTGTGDWSKQVKVGTKFANKLGAFGLGLTAYNIYDNGLNTSNGLDAVFGVIAFMGPAGTVVAGTYFLINLVVVGVTGQTIGEQIQEAITGDSTLSWKPWD